MKRLIFTVFFIVTILASNAFALEVPSRPLGRVSDYTDTLSTSQIRGLDEMLEQFEQDTTNQIAVVLIPTLAGDNLEDYSIRLAEKWKIGQAGKDNGVIVLIVKQDRKIRIEVGYGLEGVLPDSLAGEIIREKMAPSFRSDRFAEGIRLAIFAIFETTGGGYRLPTQKEEGEPTASGVSPIIIVSIFLMLFVSLFALVFGLLAATKEEWRTSSYDNLTPSYLGPEKRLNNIHGGLVGGFGGGFGGGCGGGGFSGGGGGFGGGGASGDW